MQRLCCLLHIALLWTIAIAEKSDSGKEQRWKQRNDNEGHSAPPSHPSHPPLTPLIPLSPLSPTTKEGHSAEAVSSSEKKKRGRDCQSPLQWFCSTQE